MLLEVEDSKLILIPIFLYHRSCRGSVVGEVLLKGQLLKETPLKEQPLKETCVRRWHCISRLPEAR